MGKQTTSRVAAANTATWIKYKKGLCNSCRATCCSLPVEAFLSDLVRLGLVDAFEAEGEKKAIARRLKKSGAIDHYNAKSGKFTLARRANGDCNYLDQTTRRCTVYDVRPDVCRNHPQVGPRPGYCAYIEKD